MPQPLVVGLLSAAAVVIAALVGLVGVMWAASRTYKLGTRTAGVQETSAETASRAQLVDENEKARAEVSKQWDANQKLRQTIELSDALHESECQAWSAKEKTLLSKIEEQLGQNAVLTAKLDRVSTEADMALRAQERAEGGLVQARRTISQFSSAQSSPAQLPVGDSPADPA